jgi:hypothetical protein
MVNLPALVYSKQAILSNAKYRYTTDADFEQDPPIETVIKSADIKDRVMEYLGAVLSRCWFDKELLLGLELNPHRALRSIGILLPPELDIKIERSNSERPRLIIYEWNKEHTFKVRVCYLQMIMLAGR